MPTCPCNNTPLQPVDITFDVPTCVSRIGTPEIFVSCANITCSSGSCDQSVTFQVCPGNPASEITCPVTVYTLTFTGEKQFILQVPVFDQAGCTLPPFLTFQFNIDIGTQTCYYCSPQTCPASFCTLLSLENIVITFDAAQHTLTITGDPVFNCPPSDDPSCVLTRGYYANHPEVSQQLLSQAGGQIVLGADSQAFSLTVTSQNLIGVLSGNVPGGPSPQYQQLYTQLLTAKLNVLNGAGCPLATMYINNADTFLTNPTQNDPGASDIQQLLASYNEGNADGCPEHCSGTE
ncbi:hypothetical protein [Fictibacillus fluitans]|uniref:HYR domain-containing protein n=1 Tax=Fictibacillus fluitans TaxID=3058422 RepID=A0ABT8HWF2_9BACL|nr:hypothetical protein [Fictibacillus sp. NE201]MDN4525101.1 hypothetical protein [Fictibacillus sp. NE201]